jgi:hypothetical protein
MAIKLLLEMGSAPYPLSHLDHFLHLGILVLFVQPIQNNILEPVLGWSFGYKKNHFSKSLLMKDFIPFLSSYAKSFTAIYMLFFSL